MRILNLEAVPLVSVPYRAVGPRDKVLDMDLPILRGLVDTLPNGLRGIVCTADLQGVSRDDSQDRQHTRPLGQLLLETLTDLSEQHKIPPLDRLGVLLLGDLFARPELDRRGGSGDVRAIWRMFGKQCCWVTGVAGNHDRFGDSPNDYEAFRQESGIHLLDGDVRNFDGLRIGGIGGVTGNPRRLFRRSPQEFIETLDKILRTRPDIIALHEGPNLPGTNLKGNPEVASLLSQHENLLVCFGHAFWPQPLHGFARSVQLLNVDSRVVLLEVQGVERTWY
jgi:3',5'-cyclic-AMP phosphodiesterase